MVYDLSDGVAEYFEFSIFGYKYKFKYFNTEELIELQNLADDEKKSSDFFNKFIIPIGDAPQFSEVQKKMNVAHWRKFKEMIEVEIVGKNA